MTERPDPFMVLQALRPVTDHHRLEIGEVPHAEALLVQVLERAARPVTVAGARSIAAAVGGRSQRRDGFARRGVRRRRGLVAEPIGRRGRGGVLVGGAITRRRPLRGAHRCRRRSRRRLLRVVDGRNLRDRRSTSVAGMRDRRRRHGGHPRWRVGVFPRRARTDRAGGRRRRRRPTMRRSTDCRPAWRRRSSTCASTSRRRGPRPRQRWTTRGSTNGAWWCRFRSRPTARVARRGSRRMSGGS